MENTYLTIFIEGREELLFEKVFIPLLNQQYSGVGIYKQYAEKKTSKVNSYLKSIKQTPNMDYIFLCDLDKQNEKNEQFSIFHRKEERCQKYIELEENKVFVSVEEIESWYLALASTAFLNQNGMDWQGDTQKVSKENFIQMLPKKHVVGLDRKRMNREFELNLLENTELQKGISQNASLKYFVEKMRLL